VEDVGLRLHGGIGREGPPLGPFAGVDDHLSRLVGGEQFDAALRRDPTEASAERLGSQARLLTEGHDLRQEAAW